MNPYDDDFFENDPFEDIIRGIFSGNNGRRTRHNKVISSESEERQIDYVEDENYIYLIFELPGFSEKDVNINVDGNNLDITAIVKKTETGTAGYLREKLTTGTHFMKTLPDFINPKNFKQTFRNGVLEIIFSKK